MRIFRDRKTPGREPKRWHYEISCSFEYKRTFFDSRECHKKWRIHSKYYLFLFTYDFEIDPNFPDASEFEQSGHEKYQTLHTTYWKRHNGPLPKTDRDVHHPFLKFLKVNPFIPRFHKNGLLRIDFHWSLLKRWWYGGFKVISIQGFTQQALTGFFELGSVIYIAGIYFPKNDSFSRKERGDYEFLAFNIFFKKNSKS